MSIKNINDKKQIVKALFLANNLSLLEISQRIGKSNSLTMKLVAQLVKEGILEEKGLAQSSGGRRPLLHALKPDIFYIVAVSMNQFVTKLALLDVGMKEVTPAQEIELRLAGNQGALETLIQAIEQLIESAPVPKQRILGIGIGMPGFINAEKGANYTFLGPKVSQTIKERTGYPTFIENDSTVIALSEYRYGLAVNEKNTLVLNLSWGIGLGMILEGNLFRGHDGFAGEFSHIPLFKNGRLCSCGKTGCLETESSLSYMLNRALTEIEAGKASQLTKTVLENPNHAFVVQKFIDAAIVGDSMAIEIISSAAYTIGRGIAILMHLINPGKIILSGRLAAAGKVWLAPIQQAINEFCIPKLVSNTKIELTQLGQEAELMGAATLVIENIKECSLEPLFTKNATMTVKS